MRSSLARKGARERKKKKENFDGCRRGITSYFLFILLFRLDSRRPSPTDGPADRIWSPVLPRRHDIIRFGLFEANSVIIIMEVNET